MDATRVIERLHELHWDSPVSASLLKSAHVIGTGLRGWLTSEGDDFDRAVAALATISGQEQGPWYHDDKVTVLFVGTFRGQVFTLYDYKRDRRLHIGGHAALDVNALRDVLHATIANHLNPHNTAR